MALRRKSLGYSRSTIRITASLSCNARKKGAPPPRMDDFHRYGPERKTWPELTAEEHQRYPGDHDAQYGQGAATLHSEEHLAVSDIGVVRLRRRFREQCAIVREGGRPAGLAFEDGIFPVGSGVFPVPI